MKKSYTFIIFLSIFLAGCETPQTPQSIATEAKEMVVNDNREETVINDNRETSEINDENFELNGYLYENSIGDSLYFVTIKNNGDKAVSVSGNGTAKDATGNTLGADSLSIEVIGPGETSIGYFYFDNVDEIDTVDYQLNYKESKYYYPVIGNLSIEQNLNEENLVVSVTNDGNTIASFVEAHALFFDAENKVINHDSVYITDNDSEIKPGAKLSNQLECYKGYDHVELYLTGRSDGKEVSTINTEEQGNVSDFLETNEYIYENSFGDSIYFVIVKNTSTNDYEIGGNAIAKDASGNTVGAADISIDVLGSGETTIGYFYFDSVSDIENVDYSLTVSDSYYKPVIKDLEIEKSVNNENVVITITNNGSKPAEFVEAYALFFDVNENIVDYQSVYITDDDYEIKPGVTLSEQVESYETFDHVEIYLTGRN